MSKLRKKRPRDLQYECLERREMMAVTATLSKAGVLTVKGSSQAETVNFVQSGGIITVSGAKNGSFAAANVQSIVIDLKKGNDTVSFRSTANGGTQALAENITVKSTSAGLDTVRLDDGHDVSLNGKGHSLYVSSAGVGWLDGVQLTWNNPSPPTPPSPPNPPTPPATNWFDSHVVDAALRALGSSLYADGKIDRNDMLALFNSAKDGNVVDAAELSDLRTIVGNTTLFGSLDYVRVLSGYIVNGSVANRNYQGAALGGFGAGSSSAQLDKLVNKWFLGLDRPEAAGTYRQAAGSLFVGGAAYTDVHQGYVGDCYFVAMLGEVALKNPSVITNMFVVNGDGTYTVKFYNPYGLADYVTVDSYLPTDGAGRLIYAGMGATYNNASNELWVALAEKAYAQLNEFGWSRGGSADNGDNSYDALSGGYLFAALQHITGQSTAAFTSTAGASSFTTFVSAFNAGKSIGFASMSSPGSSSVVGGHAYAVVGYNASNQTVTLFNPWGIEYGLVTMTWSQIQGSFSYFDRTA